MMEIHFKEIHIGQIIEKTVSESGIDILRICNFFKSSEEEIKEMFRFNSLDTDILLGWCKLLEYDFFRLYSQHLILYAPQKNMDYVQKRKENIVLPQFRKNIYTREIIDFIVDLINSKQKTKQEVIKEYGIPKTTLYKWVEKYNRNQ